MQNIFVEKIVHKNENRLQLRFPFDESIIAQIKTLPNSRWSQTLKAWHVPDTTECKVELAKLTRKGLMLRWVDPINGSPLNQNDTLPDTVEKSSTIKIDVSQETSIYARSKELRKSINPRIKVGAEVEKFNAYLKQRRYSPNTISTYTEALKLFLQFTDKPILEITNQDLEQFNHDFVIKNRYSSSFQNQIINAVKLFFYSIYNSRFDIDAVERPRREHKLPNVLSKVEVKQILTATKNIKHRAMLSLIYACGLRRSELINLHHHDIDSNRSLLIVRQSKGNKDRVVPLSAKTLEMLREYYATYKPKRWLFEGQEPGEQYSTTSLQQVLKQSLSNANISKPVTLHWLRHSYATHLLESGTDLRYIQELLGHRSSKTTEIYTHVTTQSIQKIKSPFDDL